jgi:hypothetical protein
MKYVSALVFIFIALQYFCDPILANNKFGVHTATPTDQDLLLAKELVNSNGGSWGYVTLVIREDDRDTARWQQVFDLLREYKLIPIVRIATRAEGGNWRRPQKDDAKGWTTFLNSLNWVVKDRYVVLFNEPNHGQEWGGRVDIESYVEVVTALATLLKESNSDYIPILAGLDVSAPSQMPLYEDAEIFIKKLANNMGNENFSKLFTMWASHSYPTDFIGPAVDGGRRSPTTYKWELATLRKYGLSNNLAVFITETGWHNTINNYEQYLKIAYENFWLKDDVVKAVNIFILNYPQSPFTAFSLIDGNNNKSAGFSMIESLPKTKSYPSTNTRIVLQSDKKIIRLTKGSSSILEFLLENNGQDILDKENGFTLAYQADAVKALTPDLVEIKPGSKKKILIPLQTYERTGIHDFNLSLLKNNIVAGTSTMTIMVEEPPKLKIDVDLFPKRRSAGERVNIEIYDKKESLIFFSKDVVISTDGILLENMNIANIDDAYRVVITKTGYLPRQAHITFSGKTDYIRTKPMLPLDANSNGKLDLLDVIFMLVPVNAGRLLP